MFTDILIVCTLMNSNEFVYFKGFPILLPICQTLNSRQILQTKELCYYKPKTKHTVSLMLTASGSVDC